MTRSLVLLACLACLALVPAEKARFDHYRVYTVVPTSVEQLAVLHSLQDAAHGLAVLHSLQDAAHGIDRHEMGLLDMFQLNFWKEVTAVGNEVDVMVPPHQLAFFTEVMADNNIASKLFIENVQTRVDEANPNAGQHSGRAITWTEYHRLDAINEWLDSLPETYPEVTVVVLGQSYEGRDIKGVKVSFSDGNPAVFIEGGIHAREWITPAYVTYMLNEVLTSTDPAVRAVVEAYDWHIFPSVNPDGYEYTHTTNRMWRKTRRPNEGSTCVGTDANRNFPTEFWGEAPGASANPCDETYGGSAPFSEVEMRAMADYMLSLPRIDVYISFHSYSQVIIYPLGHTNEPVPNRDQLQTIGDKAVTAIAQQHNTRYDAGNTVDLMYVCNGLTMDWAYLTLDVPIVYSFELRDKGLYGFLLPAEQIIPTSEETLDGVLSILGDALAAGKK